MKVKKIANKAFTLVEILVAVAVMGLLFLALYRISRDMLFSERMITYKSNVDRELSRFFDGMPTRVMYEEKDEMVKGFIDAEISLKKDIMSASYPTFISRDSIVVPWDGSTSSPSLLWPLTVKEPSDSAYSLRYYGSLDSEASSLTGSGIVCFDSTELTEEEKENITSVIECGSNMLIMQVPIFAPQDETTGKSAKKWVIKLRLRDEWVDSSGGKIRRRLERVLTYEKDGDDPSITERPVLSNVLFIKFRHRKKYTDEEIDAMNSTRGGVISEPDTDPIAGMGYFPYWANPSEMEIEICVGPDPKMAVMIKGHNLRIKASRKLEPVSIFVKPTTSI